METDTFGLIVESESGLQATVLKAVVAERNRQDRKWGKQRHINPHKWNTILMEEVGEVAEATLDLGHARAPTRMYDALRAELVQVAAVAVAALEDYDQQMAETGRINYGQPV